MGSGKLEGVISFYRLLLEFHLPRKVMLLSIIYFASRKIALLEVSPHLSHLAGVLAFLTAYSSIYLMNDFLDFSYDMKRGDLAYDKPLVTTDTPPELFAYLAYLHAVAGLLLTWLFSPMLFLLTSLTLLVAHVRHVIKPLIPRAIALTLLEFMNLLSIASVISRDVAFNRVLLMFFAVFSVFYSILYLGYRNKRLLRASVLLSLLALVFLFPHAAFGASLKGILLFIAVAVIYSIASGRIFSMRGMKKKENTIKVLQLVGIAVFMLLSYV